LDGEDTFYSSRGSIVSDIAPNNQIIFDPLYIPSDNPGKKFGFIIRIVLLAHIIPLRRYVLKKAMMYSPVSHLVLSKRSLINTLSILEVQMWLSMKLNTI